MALACFCLIRKKFLSKLLALFTFSSMPQKSKLLEGFYLLRLFYVMIVYRIAIHLGNSGGGSISGIRHGSHMKA